MVSRTDAAAYLDSQYDRLAREILQQQNDDSAAGYGPDIDQALRGLSVAEADLDSGEIADGSVLLYFALCDWYALNRFARKLATKVNIDSFAVEGDRPTVFQAVMDMLAEVGKTLDGFGYPAGIPPAVAGDQVAFEIY